MNRKSGFWIAALTLMCLVTSSAVAQEGEKQNGASKSQETSNVGSDAPPQSVQPFRLDFALNEIDNGKKVNFRRYSMDITPGSENRIKIGTRVPVVTGSLDPASPSAIQYQYVDVGTRIDARLTRMGDDLHLHVNSEISNTDIPPATDHNAVRAPIIRTMSIEGTTLLLLNKPILIGSVDDPNSTRQFQLEVTATKLR
jgi:hypothetical protein